MPHNRRSRRCESSRITSTRSWPGRRTTPTQGLRRRSTRSPRFSVSAGRARNGSRSGRRATGTISGVRRRDRRSEAAAARAAARAMGELGLALAALALAVAASQFHRAFADPSLAWRSRRRSARHPCGVAPVGRVDRLVGDRDAYVIGRWERTRFDRRRWQDGTRSQRLSGARCERLHLRGLVPPFTSSRARAGAR